MRKISSALLVAALFVTPAVAADLPLKAPSLGSYATGGCGFYFGVNTLGSAGAVNGATPGASVVQGAVGGTLGYGCPFGATPGNFWFAEGNFDWTNLNGSAQGFNMTGPAHFEQRVGFGTPISAMLNTIIPNLGLAVPSTPLLPAGITSGPSYPFIFASVHEQDVSAQFGLSSNTEWLVSPGLGIGLQTRLSNNVVAETTAQWVLQSNGLNIGPQKVSLGNAAEVGFTLKY